MVKEMTLRDMFADTVLGAMVRNGLHGSEYVASKAYEYADAMMAERDSEQKPITSYMRALLAEAREEMRPARPSESANE